MKHYTCLYYWLVEPTRDVFLDTSESQPAFELQIESDWGVNKLALFVSDDKIPEYARLTIPNLEEAKLLEEILPMIQVVKEHLLSILRITYYENVTLFPTPVWTFLEDLSSYSMGLEIQKFSNNKIDIERTKRLFVGSFPYREELRLFIDSYDERIPLQYRYLSLYKIVELHYKKQGQWNEDDFELHLRKYTSRFSDIKVTRKPASHIHMLRDKCAHIKTGKSKESFGVTQLNHKEAVDVSKILPIMSDICIDIINERANGEFVVGKKPPR